ncbi:MAG: hypothetical protein JHD28_07315 [Bacteroidia bacterium]|nr:hypothetical protein [Bacteroidia bacterium]
MRKIFIFFSIIALIASCTNDAPLNTQEQTTVDSLVNNEQAASDSLMKAIQAEIGSDTLSEDSVD